MGCPEYGSIVSPTALSQAIPHLRGIFRGRITKEAFELTVELGGALIPDFAGGGNGRDNRSEIACSHL
jgi:hypothetical protein